MGFSSFPLCVASMEVEGDEDDVHVEVASTMDETIVLLEQQQQEPGRAPPRTTSASTTPPSVVAALFSSWLSFVVPCSHRDVYTPSQNAKPKSHDNSHLSRYTNRTCSTLDIPQARCVRWSPSR